MLKLRMRIRTRGRMVHKELDWFQVRIASLRSVAEVQGKDGDWLMGVFSNAPVKQGGCSVTFHNIEIGEKGKASP